MKQSLIQMACALLLCLAAPGAGAQEWKKDFPTAEAAYTRLACEVTIRREEGKLTASSAHSEDMLLASDNAVKIMSRGYIHHSTFNELKKWTAYTRPAEGKSLKVANTTTASNRSASVFFDDAQTTSFDFTGMGTGATRHLEYEIGHSDPHLLMPFYFDRYFPVLNGELKLVFPSSVRVKYVVKGLHAADIRFSESRKRDKTVYTFTATNLPGSQHYPDAPDNSYYDTHVIFYIDQVEENNGWQNYLSGIGDLYRFNYGFIQNTNQSLSEELRHLADSLTRGAATDEEKARRIYRWVQTNIKYVAFEAGMEGFIPREASLVCTRKFGDCKDMTSILTALLQLSGVPAYFTWIGTRHLPYTYSETPLPIVDNHMICAVKLGGKFVFLDGTDPGCVFGMPSYAIQGKEALVALSEKEYKLVPVEVVPREKNTYSDSTFLEFGPAGLKGKIKIRMTGYPSSQLYTILSYRNEKEREEYFKNRFQRGSNKVRFSNWKTEPSEDRNTVLVTADMDLPDYAKKIGDEWLVNLNLFRLYEHEEIDYPRRKAPVEYDFLMASAYTTLLKLPEGYRVPELPRSQVFRNKVWGFGMQYAATGNTLSLTQTFDTDQLLLYPDQFEQWNKVLENLFPHYKQSVLLTK
ncbi:transglutaminase domain-containing protein [Paraflavisolibacter sp. H34]|uniref:transglutaminase-like domain-containing protein n=1 Tax=Huijunlia imazamoxiresistens TaxID=3127457 RepID=UPI003015D28D